MATLMGCQNGGGMASGSLWQSTTHKDEFTDKVTQMVTIGEGLSNQVIVTRSLRYYPFVGTLDGTLFVGIRSGGRYRIPTGTVQMRIDDNAAWTISPEETPLSLVPKMPALEQQAGNPSLTEIQSKAMANAMKISSPYTAATGDKAKEILRQMMSGKIVKYRTVGINQAASTTGEAAIDASFLKSLADIGITPESVNP